MDERHEGEAEALRAELRGLVQAIAAAGRATAGDAGDALLQSIVEAAARIFGAAAASIALADEAGGLQFVVAYGAGRESLLGLRIAAGQGIAGYVAASGQPLSISDVQADPRFAAQFASSTGYVPRSILAAPLLAGGAAGGEGIIGVMEVLDKLDAPAFGLRDIELLGLFARQAALAIAQSRRMAHLSEALVRGLAERLAPAERAASSAALDELLRVAEGGGDTPDGLLALAELLARLGALGEAERRLSMRLLGAVLAYAQASPPRGPGQRAAGLRGRGGSLDAR